MHATISQMINYVTMLLCLSCYILQLVQLQCSKTLSLIDKTYTKYSFIIDIYSPMMSLNKNQKTTLIWYHDNEAYLQFHMSELPIIINLYVYIYIYCAILQCIQHTLCITLLHYYNVLKKQNLHFTFTLHFT